MQAESPANRWLIAVGGVFMQIALGAVYAWSVFRIPLTKVYNRNLADVTVAFEIAIFVLGVEAYVGGVWMRRSGPRRVAIAAAILYGAGTVLAGLSPDLKTFYLSYGVIAGAGIGLGYIVPVATLIKWFPDRRGMITGIAVAGFGSGALITAPVAQRLIASYGALRTFQILGVAYFLMVLFAAMVIRNPPAGYMPPGYVPPAAPTRRSSAQDFTFGQALGTWQWYALWCILFLNTTAGIAIISQASPMAQEISGVTAAVAAGMVSLISIANGAGRFLWAWLSDAIGRKAVFLTMFLVQTAAFLMLSSVADYTLLVALAIAVLLCYGGGFGTMPAFAADYFGARDIGSIYGLMLTAWGTAGIVGPTLIAHIRQSTGHYHDALRIIAYITLASAALPLLLRPPSLKRKGLARD